MIDNANGQPRAPFNPNEHLMQIKNRNGVADYLAVQWRIAWFREKYPHGTIDTEEIELDHDREFEAEVYQWNNDTRRSEKVVKRAKGYARYKAIVTDGEGGRATGHKTERAVDFADYAEKAETGSIGRALANLGYGTQFTGDEFDERHRIVDAPVDHGASNAAVENNHTQKASPVASVKPVAVVTGGAKVASNRQQKVDEIDPNGPATDEQLSTIAKLCQHLGGKQVDRPANYLAAKELIAQLSQEYRQNRQSRKTAS